MFYVHTRCIVNKISELQKYVFELNPDITFITELWDNNTILVEELTLQGYTSCIRVRWERGVYLRKKHTFTLQ